MSEFINHEGELESKLWHHDFLFFPQLLHQLRKQLTTAIWKICLFANVDPKRTVLNSGHVGGGHGPPKAIHQPCAVFPSFHLPASSWIALRITA